MVKHKMENLLGFPIPGAKKKKKKGKLLYHECLLLCDRILTVSQAAHQIAWLAVSGPGIKIPMALSQHCYQGRQREASPLPRE